MTRSRLALVWSAIAGLTPLGCGEGGGADATGTGGSGGGAGGAIADSGVGGSGGAGPSPDAGPEGPIYDLAGSAAAHELPLYRPNVGQFQVLDAALTQPTGRADLFVGHPTRFTARVHVTAEPLEAPLYYGLRSGDTYCVIGDVGVDHLPDFYEAASRANAALAAQMVPPAPGSLADCAATHACEAEGEECVGVRGPPVEAGYDPEAEVDPNASAVLQDGKLPKVVAQG